MTPQMPLGPMSRRRFLTLTAAAGLAAGGPRVLAASPGSSSMTRRTIPSSGELLPAIGLGTYRSFDAEDDGARAPLRDVLRVFFDGGGRAIDSSPMYGRSEAVVGDLLRDTPWAREAFVATKVWTSGREEGIRQMEESERLMGGRIDLMQIHNLVDWKTHLPTLRAWKAQGRIRYVGITHYALGSFDELERILRKEKVDFVQLPYSVGLREAEKRLLPAAHDTGTAVLVMRPFEAGSLVHGTRGRPLPEFASELGATSWPQVLLKWILAHPAVTTAIPATSNPRHMAENVAAGSGALPDEALRRKIVAALGA